MPVLKPCTYPGCKELVSIGRCQQHKHQQNRILTTTQRGYDAAWERLRDLKLATDPFCQIRTNCEGATATEVDHIQSISQRPDLRLEWSNLQSSCKPCNVAKRNRENRIQSGEKSQQLSANAAVRILSALPVVA